MINKYIVSDLFLTTASLKLAIPARIRTYDFCEIICILRVAQFVWICTTALRLTPALNLPVTGFRRIVLITHLVKYV